MRIAVCLLLLVVPALGQGPGPASSSQLPPASNPQLASAGSPVMVVTRPAPPAWEQTAPSSDYVPLTSRQKLNVFVKRTYSPLTFLSTAFDAGIAQASADHEHYGQGAQGYGKRYGATFADNETGVFFQHYLLPTMFHQDPRYFRRPELPAFRRAMYALSRTVLTRNDSGHTGFNVSYLAGGLISTSIANTYYPFDERGMEDTMLRFGWGTLSDSGLLVLHEFWPDIKAKLTGTRAYRRLTGTKLGQGVERRVEGLGHNPENDTVKNPQKSPENPPENAPAKAPAENEAGGNSVSK